MDANSPAEVVKNVAAAGAAVVEWTADPDRAFLAPGAQTRRGQPRRELAEVGA